MTRSAIYKRLNKSLGPNNIPYSSQILQEICINSDLSAPKSPQTIPRKYRIGGKHVSGSSESMTKTANEWAEFWGITRQGAHYRLKKLGAEEIYE